MVNRNIQRRVSCTRKKQHSTEEKAIRHADNRNSQLHNRAIFKVYRCKFCKNWHIGRSGRKKKR